MKKSIVLLLSACALLSWACVKVDNSLGKGLVDKNLIFSTYTEEFELEDIQLKLSEDLSGYSDAHLTIGAIRDDKFGLSTRGASFPLVPALDTVDLGTNPKAISFTLYFEGDSISCSDDSQKAILQNINVYELLESVPEDVRKATYAPVHSKERITKGIPVYDGTGGLDFNFTTEYAQKYLDVISLLGPVLKDRNGSTDVYDLYIDALPGIYINTDAPAGNGGRINLFNFSCLSVYNNYYYRNDNVGVLKYSSEWNGVKKDSTLILVPGEMNFEDESVVQKNNEKFYQYCFNHTTHSTSNCKPTDEILVEGGTGLKPVISAKELREKTIKAIEANGGDPEKVIIVKASIELPYEQPADYMEMKYFPPVLSPTIRTTAKDEDDNEIITFAGLTDASISDEDQGDIDRSNLIYAPDITYHLQELLKRTDLDTATNADVWLLTIHEEKVANANGSMYDSEYYQNLMYASYYNSIYGGGYGYGYGSYGGYGYNNYYNYMMMAQMMAASTQQTYSVTQELDKDRYYKAVLNGPSKSRKPVFRVTYAFPGK